MWNLGYFGVPNNKKNTQKKCLFVLHISTVLPVYVTKISSRKNYSKLDSFLCGKLKPLSLPNTFNYQYAKTLPNFVTLL